jgi:hypothetical protein
MPLIKPRTRGKHFVRLITRLERENHATLQAYAQFLAEVSVSGETDGAVALEAIEHASGGSGAAVKPETIEYVINEVIESLLARDKDFAAWRATRPDQQLQVPPTRRRRRRSPTRLALSESRHAAAVN